MTFKYQEQIDRLLSVGYTMPTLHKPNGKDGYRYVFADDNANNHKPVCIQNPSRRLPDNKNSVAMPFLALTKTSGLFDLYESTICDLNKTFRFIETLWKN